MKAKTDFWWYRLLQVAFGLTILVMILGLAAMAIEALPAVSVENSTYSIVCHNGKTLTNLHGSRVTPDGMHLRYAEDGRMMRYGCSLPAEVSFPELQQKYAQVIKSDYYKPIGGRVFSRLFSPTPSNDLIPDQINYDLVVNQKLYDPPWWRWVIGIPIGLSIIVVLSLVIRAVALYILFKEPLSRNTLRLVTGIFKRS